MQNEKVQESNTVSTTVPSITNFRLRLDMYINSTQFLRPSREVSLAHTHLQRAFMWLGKAQGAAGGESPYKESFNHKTPTIEPTADHSPTSLMNALWDMPEYGTHTARVKSLRSLMADHIKEFKDFVKTSESAGADYDMYLNQSRLAAEEASMWLGWELASIKRQQDSPDNGAVARHPASNLPL